jgi:uncharacterized oligopeptide transporter (OPT) family protein
MRIIGVMSMSVMQIRTLLSILRLILRMEDEHEELTAYEVRGDEKTNIDISSDKIC